MKANDIVSELWIVTVYDARHDEIVKEVTVFGKHNLDKAIKNIKSSYMGYNVGVNKGIVCFDGYVAKGDYIGDF